MAQFDMAAFCRAAFRPGVNHNTDGARGGGKTHQAIAYAEPLVEGKIEGMPPVVLLTNVVFVTRTASGLRTGYPDGVFRITTMAEMFRKIGELLQQYGPGNVTILVVLDEAQNFMLADLNGAEENLALVKFMANTRKFGVCMWLLTPTINNLVPRIRNFQDDDKPGYCGCLWRKDPVLARKFIKRHNMKAEAREFTTMRMRAKDTPVLMRVGTTAWTTPMEKLPIGGFCYDHLSAADFSLGEGFDFKKFISKCSGVASFEIPSAIAEFFAEADGPEEAENKAIGLHLRDQALRVDRMRELIKVKGKRLTWDQVALIEGETVGALRGRYQRYFELNPSQKISEASTESYCTSHAGKAGIYIVTGAEKKEEEPDLHAADLTVNGLEIDGMMT